MIQFGELIAGETLASIVETLDTPDKENTVDLEMVGKVWFGIKK